MRCVACNTPLLAFSHTDLCTKCRGIVRLTALGRYKEPVKEDVQEIIECLNISIKQGHGYLTNSRGD